MKAGYKPDAQYDTSPSQFSHPPPLFLYHTLNWPAHIEWVGGGGGGSVQTVFSNYCLDLIDYPWWFLPCETEDIACAEQARVSCTHRKPQLLYI